MNLSFPISSIKFSVFVLVLELLDDLITGVENLNCFHFFREIIGRLGFKSLHVRTGHCCQIRVYFHIFSLKIQNGTYMCIGCL